MRLGAIEDPVGLAAFVDRQTKNRRADHKFLDDYVTREQRKQREPAAQAFQGEHRRFGHALGVG